MARYRFRTDLDYPARLYRVTERSIENETDGRVRLLRLEFEIFVQDQQRDVFRSTGKVASRDLLVGLPADPGVRRYQRALGIEAENSAAWLAGDLVGRWVSIRFDSVDESDFRNPFASIKRRATPECDIVEYVGGLLDQWCGVSEAAEDLELSPATLRRRLAILEPTWGERLVRRTTGGHRRICLPLLRNLL
ncbi:MAG: LysR family transcriptional regulator [Planctomycetota bacterium]